MSLKYEYIVLEKIVKIVSVQVELYKYEHGEYGEGVNTADCGSVMLGFESLYPPHIEIYAHLCVLNK